MEKLKNTKFFSEFDWDGLMAKKMTPPIKPDLSNKMDLKFFDKESVQQSADMTQLDSHTLEKIKKNQEKFKDF